MVVKDIIILSSKFAPIAGPCILLVVAGMILSTVLINVIWIDSAYGQILPMPGLPNVTGRTTVTKPLPLPASRLPSSIAHGVKITSPIKGQRVPVGILTIAGTSKDNATSGCHVSIIVNGRKPYQNVTANGPSGNKDYSKWSVTLSPKYALIKQGANKITAKFYCSPNPTIASFYSVNVTGVGATAAPAVQNETRSTSATTTDYKLYNNSTVGIKIEVPSDWFYKETNNTVSFLPPKSLPFGIVTVCSENIPNGTSFDTYTKTSTANLQQTIPSFHLITSNTTTLANNNPAHQIVFTSQTPSAKILVKNWSVYTLKNGKVYTISYVSTIDRFPVQLPIVKHMIDSFKITK